MKKILVAPLDWGLGHATRSIPVIKQLQKSGCSVTIAASGSIKTLLEKEFPGIPVITLFGYNIKYTLNKRWLPLKILLQAPKIMLAIKREHTWLQKTIAENGFDAVISDNRFGLWSTKIPCIFITHQLLIQAPFGWLQKMIQNINYSFINRFAACWVPDYEEGTTIAGELSHPPKMPAVATRYIGPLSRFEEIKTLPKKYEWMIMLSGPEPQRTILEEKLLIVIPKLEGKVLLARGKPGSDEQIKAPANCTVVNHLSTPGMLNALAESEYVVSRCGYTTVMEILSLEKKAVFIPTPGQTEQEYLAAHLFSQGWCYTCLQEDNLAAQLTNARLFDFKLPVSRKNTLEEIITEFLA